MQLLLQGISLLTIILIWIFALYQMTYAIGGIILFFKARREKSTIFDNLDELPPITILVPAHNEEKVIERTVCCLLSLHYPGDKLCLLVIDDASSDDTPAILDRLAAHEPRLRVLHRTKDEGGKGKAAALNAAMEFVETEFVAIFDADNRPEPDAIAYLVARVMKEPELAGAVGRFRTGNKHRNTLTRVINLEGLAFQGIMAAGRWQFLRVAALTGTNYIIRRSALAVAGGWDEEALTEDTELSVRLYQLGYRIAFVPYSITWEQEPETPSVWLKQRTRWARGNNYAIMKIIRLFSQFKSKGLAFEALFNLFVPYLFMIAIIGSQITGLILLIPGMEQASWLSTIGNFWWIILALYFCEFMLALSYDKEILPSNVALVFLMYFTYSHAWLLAVLRALWLDVVMHERHTWYKTVRFDSEIIPRYGSSETSEFPEIDIDEDELLDDVEDLDEPEAAAVGAGMDESAPVSRPRTTRVP